MKAFVRTKYGLPDVLQLQEIEKPAPNEDEVLVKVQAVALNMYDWHLLVGEPFLFRPAFKTRNNILGADIAGQVEAVGSKVTQFQPGDAVYGDIASCGAGGFAEYACATENVLALKPVRLKFAEAAAVPMAALTALQGLRDIGKIQAGQKVLVNGASGGVGTFAVQIAKAYGAEVTAVCSTANIEMARSLGADHVIDYSKEDFTKNGQRYDLILAANGYHPIFDYRRALSPVGIYVMTGGSWGQIFQALFLAGLISSIGGKKMQAASTKSNRQDLDFMNTLIEAGKVSPVIDRSFPFSAVPDAFRYLGEGHARGKVVITVQ